MVGRKVELEVLVVMDEDKEEDKEEDMDGGDDDVVVDMEDHKVDMEVQV